MKIVLQIFKVKILLPLKKMSLIFLTFNIFQIMITVHKLFKQQVWCSRFTIFFFIHYISYKFLFHINIRSLDKNFEKLIQFLNIMKNEFDVIAISERWCNDDCINVNSLYQIPNYITSINFKKLVIRVEGWQWLPKFFR